MARQKKTTRFHQLLYAAFYRLAIVLFASGLAWAVAVETGLLAEESKWGEVIKKSSSGICHCPDGQYYDRTKNFTEYRSIHACLADGGRHPKKGQGDCSKIAPPEPGSPEDLFDLPPDSSITGDLPP